ncbi:MAG: PAS domain-containing sensor histidine kinase [Pseudomonadota bacterium]
MATTEFDNSPDQVFSDRGADSATLLATAALGPVLLAITYVVLRMNVDDPTAWSTRAILVADLAYIIFVFGVVGLFTVRLIRARKHGSAGAKLHFRLGGMFAMLALLPTIVVAVFAAIFFNFALEGWFSDRVSAVVGSSLSAAEAYEAEQKDDLVTDTRLLANYINNVKRRSVLLQDDQLRQALAQGQSLVQRGLKEAYIVNGAGELLLRGENSYLFDFERPTPDQMIDAGAGGVVVLQDWDGNEFRAIYRLSDFVDRYLYVARSVDGQILNLLDETQETALFYRSLEQNSGRLLYDLSLVYFFFAIVVTFSAVLVGLRFAERLARPVGDLASAAERVGAGDFDAHVPPQTAVDELAVLATAFNQMTSQVKQQRDDLLTINEETEEQRSLFDSVLSNVTAGVIGLTADGKIEVLNDAAAALLSLDKRRHLGRAITDAVPEFERVWMRMQGDPQAEPLDEIKLNRAGKAEVLLVKMTARRAVDEDIHGYVVTFDDVTELVSAQRMAAWGDVARRLAHEIKNPLTPIQLSAERLRRKFEPIAGDQTEALDQYTNVIIRQAGDLRRIVDEFAKFARMPEPDVAVTNVRDVLSEVVLLQKNALTNVNLQFDPPEEDVLIMADQGLMTQAVMNVIKNAGEAVSAFAISQGAEFSAEIRVGLSAEGGSVVVTIEDNGPGFPSSQRSRLIEPYVTNREGGSGLGLSIVKKIVEQHGGTLELLDAVSFDPPDQNGARVRIRLPKVVAQKKTVGDKADLGV